MAKFAKPFRTGGVILSNSKNEIDEKFLNEMPAVESKITEAVKKLSEAALLIVK